MFECKRTIIAIFMVSSSLSFAGSVGEAEEVWSMGGSALYLQPTFGGNGLGYTAYSNYSGNDNDGNFVGSSGTPNLMSNIFPKWGLGFQVEGAYRVKVTDLAVRWYHLSENTQGRFPIGSAFSGNNDGFYASSFQVKTAWDEIDVDLGRSIYISEKQRLRPHAGVEFARISNQFKNAPMLNPTAVLAYTTIDTLSYRGFGPRLGVDFGYTLKPGLELYAKATGSLLVGTSKQHNAGYQTYPYPNNPPSPFVTGNYFQSSQGVVVPELAAKLGAQYGWAIAPEQSLTIDVGYLWINYLNAIVSYVGNGLVFANVGANSSANFNLNGLYLGLRWAGN